MRHLFTVIFVLITLGCVAQATYEDVVYLKNGSIIHGMIIEQIPNTSIKIKNKLGDIIFYKMEEIEKFTKEEVKVETPKAKDTLTHERTMVTLEPGGLFAMSADVFTPSFMNGKSSHYRTSTQNAFQLTINIDKEVGKRVYLGGGFGFALSKYPMLVSAASNVSVIVPGYFDLRYMILAKKHTPYIAFQAGAALYATRGTFGGGAASALQFGGRFRVSRKVALSIFAGYRFQHITTSTEVQYTDDQGNNTVLAHVRTNSILHFLMFGGGISF